jgi:cobalt-zinc-cadmium efflux system outer membrane protein
MSIPKHLPILLLGLAWTAAMAQTRLGPEEVTRMALDGNPELRAARQILGEATARLRGSGRLSNPELGVEVAGGRDWEGRVEVGLTQWFPVTSRLRWERRLSELELAMARCEVAGRELEIVGAAQTAWVELAAAQEAVRLVERQVQLAESEAAAFRKQALEGTASAPEAGSRILAAGEIGLQGAEVKAAEAQAAAKLATLLGLPADRSLIAPRLTLPDSLPAQTTALRRPDLQLAELALEAGAADVALARASRWQDVGVGFFAEGERNRDEPEGIDTEGLLGLRATVALPLWQNGRARVTEKEAGRIRREHHLAALRLAAGNEATAAWRMMKIRYEAARQSAELLPAARRNLAEYEAAHQRGEIGPSEVFRARERLAALERADIEARRAFFLARIQWRLATGSLFSRP